MKKVSETTDKLLNALSGLNLNKDTLRSIKSDFSTILLDTSLFKDDSSNDNNPLVDAPNPHKYIKKEVVVTNVGYGAIDTTGKHGYITSYDVESKKYGIDFGSGWCGFYYGEQIKLTSLLPKKPKYSNDYKEVGNTDLLIEYIENYNTDADCDDWIKELGYIESLDN
jgi:hypothetical protein